MSNYTEFVTKGGEKLLVKRVPRNMLSRFALRLPALPKPPLRRVPIEGGETLVPYEADTPEYQAWQAAYESVNTDRNLKLAMNAVHLGVRLPKERRAEIVEDVAELRERAASMGMDIHPDDETAYIWEFVLGDQDDLAALNKIMYAQNHPTEEAVKAHQDGFRNDVRGQTPGEVPAAAG